MRLIVYAKTEGFAKSSKQSYRKLKKYPHIVAISRKHKLTGTTLFQHKRIITEYAEKKRFEVAEWYSEGKVRFKGKGLSSVNVGVLARPPQ